MSDQGHVPDVSTLQVRVVSTRAELEAAWRVRVEVFVDEQHVPPEEEVDDLDEAETTTHVLVVDTAAGADEPVGTGRLLADPEHPGVLHIGRLAVRAPWRSAGVGSVLMRALEELAAGRAPVDSAVRVELSAQEQAIGFYERLGYTVEGERYLDAGIWHKDAWRTVPGTA